MSKTLYLPIKLNNTVKPIVGAFIPDHYRPATAVNIVVYFHGNIIPDCGTEPARFKTGGIEYYWGTPLFRCLREDLDSSSANAILVAPTLSLKFGSVSPNWASRYGNLDAAGKFDDLLQQVLTRLKSENALPATAQVGNIILSGHSAGGVAMMKILEARNALKANIAECWGFECLYFGTSTWKAWMASNPHKQFRHFRQPNAQADATNELKGRANFVDTANGSSHCSLLKEKWRAAIDACGVLRSTDEIA